MTAKWTQSQSAQLVIPAGEEEMEQHLTLWKLLLSWKMVAKETKLTFLTKPVCVIAVTTVDHRCNNTLKVGRYKVSCCSTALSLWPCSYNQSISMFFSVFMSYFLLSCVDFIQMTCRKTVWFPRFCLTILGHNMDPNCEFGLIVSRNRLCPFAWHEFQCRLLYITYIIVSVFAIHRCMWLISMSNV